MSDELVTITIATIVHGGQGLGTNDSGKKVFVWNALPGETVGARIIKRKRSYDEAIAEHIITASPQRIAAVESNFLATSPWQIMNFETENAYKKQIALDVFTQENVILPTVTDTVSGEQWRYRNKMEYSFWGDDNGLHLALYQRGTHGKQIVTGSQLALAAIDKAAKAICAQLQALGIRAGDLKTVVVRASQNGQAVAALFVKTKDFKPLVLPEQLQGLVVFYSNPKSPASVMTELLQELGDCNLQDTLLGKSFTYDVNSFFQVNIPVFERALSTIAQNLHVPHLTDMYAGVGSIGLSVAAQAVTLVELDIATAAMAAVNAEASSLKTEVVKTSAEASLEYITSGTPVVVDPPRAGLHPKVTARLLEALPPQIAYLSCNPATHARDIGLLQQAYDITHFSIYNFFPRTPHIETLALLTRRA